MYNTKNTSHMYVEMRTIHRKKTFCRGYQEILAKSLDDFVDVLEISIEQPKKSTQNNYEFPELVQKRNTSSLQLWRKCLEKYPMYVMKCNVM